MCRIILNMRGIQKYFAGVHALNGVDFDLKAGEVHALMGENGAGKSTLIKVLCGIHKRDGGADITEGKDPSIGYEAVKMAINKLEGKEISDVGIPGRWYNTTNIDELKEQNIFYEG